MFVYSKSTNSASFLINRSFSIFYEMVLSIDWEQNQDDVNSSMSRLHNLPTNFNLPIILANVIKINSFKQSILLRSTGIMSMVTIVFSVRFSPFSLENQREEKSQPDSQADTKFEYSLGVSATRQQKIIIVS